MAVIIKQFGTAATKLEVPFTFVVNLPRIQFRQSAVPYNLQIYLRVSWRWLEQSERLSTTFPQLLSLVDHDKFGIIESSTMSTYVT